MKRKFLLALLLVWSPLYLNSSEQDCSIEAVEREGLENIEVYQQRQVPGLTVSYRTVIDTLIEAGHDVFIRGGAMRDLLGPNQSEPKDIDFDYSGTVEELKEILEKKQWMYTLLPGRSTIVIGDHRGAHMEAVPLSVALSHGDSTLEFTINNIFYHCNERKIVPGTEIGLIDLEYQRLNILNPDLKSWLYRKGRHPYERIYRSWNMIGKGFVYTSDFANFLHREAKNKLRRYPDFFKSEMLHYLGAHYESFVDVYYGSISIMGYDWARENVLPLREEAEEKSLQGQEVRDQYTHFK